GERGVAFDGDVVVVVESNQLAKLGVTGEGCGLVGDTFHHVAVAGDEVRVVIEDFLVTVEYSAHVCFADGHSNGIADSLAERSGGGFNAGRVTVLGVTGGLALPLPELLQIIEREI